MSHLSNVLEGIIRQAVLAVVYGPDGTGKSTLGNEFEAPIFVGAERGTDHLNAKRFPHATKLSDVMEQIAELTNDAHPYKTLVVDSLDWMERLIWNEVCMENKWDSIESPGYGKGYKVAATKYWPRFINALTRLRDAKGMNILLICHSELRTIHDPRYVDPYDTYQMKLQKDANALVREYVDVVLFLTTSMTVFKDRGAAKAKAVGGEDRVMYTERCAAYYAKNRLDLPAEIPFIRGKGWTALKAAIAAGDPNSVSAVKNSITNLLTNINDSKVVEKAVKAADKAGDDVSKLYEIETRLRTIVEAA